jgi:hypothetical protein
LSQRNLTSQENPNGSIRAKVATTSLQAIEPNESGGTGAQWD